MWVYFTPKIFTPRFIVSVNNISKLHKFKRTFTSTRYIMKSRFTGVEPAEKVDIVQAREAMEADTYEKKVDLVIGAYRTAEGKPMVMPFIQKIEQEIASDPNMNHEYLMFLGLEKFNKVAPRLILGENSPAILEGRAFGAQTLSGTGAIRMGVEFLKRHLHYKTIYTSTPTYENHSLIFRYGGFTDVRFYRYWNFATRQVDFTALLEDFHKAPENSVIMLQVTAHNPTGCDLTREQWTMVADVMEKRKLFPFFDAAYQGFATGDLDRDAWPVRYFVDRGFELFVAQSFSKNMALYSERIGCLTVVLGGKAQDNTNVSSQLKLIARATYVSPPKHGALIVSTVLTDPALIEEWKKCLKEMVDRIQSVRIGLKERLQKLGTPGNWDHITNQIGMFSFLGLTTHQIEYIKRKHHIHMLSNSRANICGISDKNIDQVAEAIHDTVVYVNK